MTPVWLSAAIWAVGLLLFADFGTARGIPALRKPASPSYRGRDTCPTACNIAGPNPSNWSVYHNFEQLQNCQQTLFYEFSLYDAVDDPETPHRIYACASYGADWFNLPQSQARVKAAVQSVNSTYQVGWWADGALAATDISAVSKQMRHYLKSDHATSKSNALLFARSGSASVGVYIGKSLQKESVSSFALKSVEENIHKLPVNTGTMAMQLCEPNQNSGFTFGLIASSNNTFAPVQEAMKTWSKGGCLSFQDTRNITGVTALTSPLVVSTNKTRSASVPSSSTPAPSAKQSGAMRIAARAECSTTQVVGGDSCAALATRCGISGADFTKYNPGSSFCSSLRPGQHVCCSSGTLPDFAPKPNEDGSCATYTVQTDDNCADLAAAYSLTNDDLEEFNQNTWGWNGCSNIWTGTVMCLSKGSPPMPAPVENAVCGPQVPGTETPADTTNLTHLNPCPLNACCNVWGQCGTTDEFCTDTSTGAPGSAEKGTNGCISNCGTQMVRGSAPEVFRSIAYFEGYSFNGRECLYQDALQIDGSKFTHLHFAFGTLTDDYQVVFEDSMMEYQFSNFLAIEGPKKILSFGGWDFSTQPATYNIFRQGVKPANRLKFATNVANFIKARGVDGVDIDWEYPGAPDIPGIPPADKDDGDNYLAFLVILKNLLPGKSISIAAASSYFYLKNFPIEKISKVVDYIIYMTYDLHGQWDAQNANAQIGCPSGNCLRSHVNLTETINSLVMITKAGVPSNKVVVGVASYGRSFAMADPSCTGPNCFFTGAPYDSPATKGVCTATGGYIADAEINEILSGSTTADGLLKRDGRVTQHYVDATSNSDIIIYDNNQWAAYMGPEIKASRKSLYQGLNMGGSSDWATDLQKYNDPPQGGTWGQYKATVNSGTDPWQVGNRTGDWMNVHCTDQPVVDVYGLAPWERWEGMDCEHAWADAIDVYKNIDRPNKDKGGYSFSQSIAHVIHAPPSSNCEVLLETDNCSPTLQCDGFDTLSSGAGGWAIWNSLVEVHEMYSSYYHALFDAAASTITNSLDDFENKFAPIPDPPDNTWLLLLIDLITLGAASVAAPFFNSFLAKMPYFILKDTALNNLKDTTMTIISQSTTIAKDLLSDTNPDKWTPEKQDSFSNYMGQTIDAWATATEQSLSALFNGEDSSIDALTKIISDGKLIEGKGTGLPTAGKVPTESASSLRHSVSKSFFAFAIPAIWQVSGQYPFIIDSGYDCGTIDPMGSYMDEDTQHATWSCWDGKLYYLANPKGDATFCTEGGCIDEKFSAPPGIDSLDGSTFGGIEVGHIVNGSVRTWLQNGKQNGGGAADPANSGTLEDLYNTDVTTPGFIRLPVCSADYAFKAWSQSGGPYTSVPNYPCIPHQAKSHCGDSTFVGETSDASPNSDDCMQIVKNIQNTDGEWEVENAIGSQHQLVQYGTCAFGVQGKGKNGNIDFHIGAQDIVDIITDAVNMWGGGGKVGGKGEMTCDGTVKGQKVEWGLYHD